MNAVIKILREQHQEILRFLEQDEDLLKVIDFVENIHHKMEENVLFPLVAEHPLLNEGGPRCALYWGIELDLAPQRTAQNLLTRLTAKGIKNPCDYHETPWLGNSSPLNIPMTDHKLNAELAYAIRKLSEQPKSPVSCEFLDQLKHEYVRLLKAHIDKEENCLFVMCERILSQSLTIVG